MTETPSSRITPWVARIGLGLAASFVILRTVVTAPEVAQALRFPAGAAADRPWTVLTYPLVHEGVLHLGAIVALLLVLGPAVERRLGGPAFLAFWWYCAAGAAVVGIALNAIGPVPPMSGGLAPALGLAFAYAWFDDDEEVRLDPIPVRVRVRLLILLLLLVAMVAGLIARQPALSIVHLGGVPAAWLFLRLRALGQRPPAAAPLPARRPVMAPIRLEVEAATTTAATPPPAVLPSRDPRRATSDEVNRVLDKISALGMESLTEDERRILTEYAARKRREEQ